MPTTSPPLAPSAALATDDATDGAGQLAPSGPTTRAPRSQRAIDARGHERIPGGTYTGSVIVYRESDGLTTRQHFTHGHHIVSFLTVVSVAEAIDRCIGPISGPDTIGIADDWYVDIYYGPL